MIRLAPALAALAAAATSFLAPLAAQAACSIGYETLPVTMQNLQAHLDAKINGHPVRFVVDSGAFFSMITPGTAAELKLPQRPLPANFVIRGLGGDVVPYLTEVNLGIAGADLHNIQFLVGGGETGGGTAGLLGQNVLHILDVEYDFADGLIRIVRAKGCEHADMVYWDPSKDHHMVPLTPSDPGSRMTTAYAAIDGKRIRVMFDTGSNLSYVSLAAARRLGFDPKAPGVVDGGLWRGIGRRPFHTWIMPVDSFSLGDEEVRHTQLRVGEADLPDVDMLVGADFFLSHHVYVANSVQRIFFTYNGGPVFNLRTEVADVPPAPAPVATQDGAKPSAAGDLAEGAQPKDADGYARRGAASLARREFAQAIADLTKAHDMAPGEAAYLYERGLAYRDNRQPFLARADFDAALKIDPASVDARIARAEMEFVGRERASALADLDAVAAAAPKPADVRLALGELYLRADAFAPAAAQLDLWIHAHDDDARLEHALAARCWAGAMGGEDAGRTMAACDSALRRGPKDPLALNGRGWLRLRQNTPDKAVADFNAALAERPKSGWALYGRAVAEQKGGQADASKADLAAALAAQPKIVDEARAQGLAP
jgi:tetratricopeptide (TPR) repeat protein/predicted aspartyl protease